jgi:endonuclease/exonuclease/phosphatase family metal-dependent hydrolase
VPPKAAGTHRLVQLNIAHGRGLAVDQHFVPDGRITRNLTTVGTWLQATAPDLVALQEVDVDSSWNGNFDHLAHVAEEVGLPHRAMGTNNLNGGRYRLNYGNGTLARWPVARDENHPFGTARLGEKGFLYTEFVVDGQRLGLINVHLDFRRRQTRLRQVQQVIDWLAAERRRDPALPPPLVVGDLNCELSAPKDAARVLYDYLRDWSEYHVEPQTADTFPVYEPRRAIDLVYVPGQLEVVAVTVPEVSVSDHRPVIVDFRLRPARP